MAQDSLTRLNAEDIAEGLLLRIEAVNVQLHCPVERREGLAHGAVGLPWQTGPNEEAGILDELLTPRVPDGVELHLLHGADALRLLHRELHLLLVESKPALQRHVAWDVPVELEGKRLAARLLVPLPYVVCPTVPMRRWHGWRARDGDAEEAVCLLRTELVGLAQHRACKVVGEHLCLFWVAPSDVDRERVPCPVVRALRRRHAHDGAGRPVAAADLAVEDLIGLADGELPVVTLVDGVRRIGVGRLVRAALPPTRAHHAQLEADVRKRDVVPREIEVVDPCLVVWPTATGLAQGGVKECEKPGRRVGIDQVANEDAQLGVLRRVLVV